MTRYKRHIALNEIGAKGQSKINNTSVLVVGVGGLGSPVIEYLSRAGVGVIGIIDFDNVELSNLQRQIIFSEDDLNKNKAICAQEYIKRINSSIKTKAYSEALTIQNGSKIIQQYDIIVDGTDDVKIRYLLNDFCVLLDKPLVYAALYKFEGQISVFNYNQGPTYRCLFPIIPKEDELPNCSQTGVLGVVPGILGIYQANEVLKIILDIGDVLSGKVLSINLLKNIHTTFRFSKNEIEVSKLIEKGVPYSDSISLMNSDYRISLNSLTIDDKCIFVDVRNEDEEPVITHKKIHHIPLGKLKSEILNIISDKKIIFFCSSGKRSIKAANFTNKNFNVQSFSLKEGAVVFNKWINE